MSSPKSLRFSFIFATALIGLIVSACANSLPASTATAPVLPTIPSITAAPVASAPPSQSSPSATPQPTQTPAIPVVTTSPTSQSSPTWLTTAVEIQDLSQVHSLYWQDDNSLMGYGEHHELHTLDTSTGIWTNALPTAMPTVTPTIYPLAADSELIFSSDQKFAVECTDKYLRLYRLSDAQLLDEHTNDPDGYCYSISWAPDDSAVSFVTQQAIYIWKIDATEIKKAVSNPIFAPPNWSPDSKRLIIFRVNPEDAGFATVDIAYMDDTPTIVTGIQIVTNDWEPTAFNWLTNDLLGNWHGCGASCFFATLYNAYSGKELTIWGSEYGFTQRDYISPDKQWFIVNGNYSDAQDYELINLAAQHVFLLAHGNDIYLQYIDWSPDSATFYLVSRPTASTSVAKPDLPFGLLALDPKTQTYTQLFKDAMFAQWSPDHKYFWVLFPTRTAAGNLGLSGGIFDPTSGTLQGRQAVSDQILYANPANGNLTPIVWSHNSQSVVFEDSSGNLWLTDLNGHTQQLASNLSPDTWPNTLTLAWSPDDHKLLVQATNQAWVVSVPNP